MPYENPTRRLAEQARASGQKVARAREQQVATGEHRLDRQQRGAAQTSQALAETGRQLQREEEFEEQKRITGVQEKRQEEATAEEQQRYEAETEARKEQFQAEYQLEQDKLSQRASEQAARTAQATKELELREEALDVQRQGVRAKRAEIQQARIEEQAEIRDKRRTEFQGRLDKLDSALRKFQFGGSSGDLDQAGKLIALAEKKLGDNQKYKDSVSDIKNPQASPEARAQAYNTIMEGIRDAKVAIHVERAGVLGEWSPTPEMQSHPEVQQFNANLATAQLSMNRFNQMMMMGLGMAGIPEPLQQYMNTLQQTSPEMQRRVLVKMAYEQMQSQAHVRSLQQGVEEHQRRGRDMDLGLETPGQGR